jgi:uncharacterized protein YoxC
MLLSTISFISNIFIRKSKVFLILAIGFFVFIFLTVAFFTIKHTFEQNAILKQNVQILQSVTEQQQRFIAQQREILQKQDEITKELMAKNQNLERKIDAVNSYLQSNEAQRENKVASPIIRETIRILRERN